MTKTLRWHVNIFPWLLARRVALKGRECIFGLDVLTILGSNELQSAIAGANVQTLAHLGRRGACHLKTLSG